MGMSFYFVNKSAFMGLVAKNMQERKEKLEFLIFRARLVGEENEEHMF